MSEFPTCLFFEVTTVTHDQLQMMHPNDPPVLLSLNFFFSQILYSCSKGFKEEHCKVFSNISLLGVISCVCRFELIRNISLTGVILVKLFLSCVIELYTALHSFLRH